MPNVFANYTNYTKQLFNIFNLTLSDVFKKVGVHPITTNKAVTSLGRCSTREEIRILQHLQIKSVTMDWIPYHN